MNHAIRVWLKKYWGWPFSVVALPIVLFSAKWLYALYVPFLTVPGSYTPSGKDDTVLAGIAVVGTWFTVGGTVAAVLYHFFGGLNEYPPEKKEREEPEKTDWR